MPPSLGKVLARLMRTLHTVLLAAALALTVQATASAVTFNATLGSIRITARPGQVLTREFRLTLDADQPKTRFNSHMQDWWRNEDGTHRSTGIPILWRTPAADGSRSTRSRSRCSPAGT